MTDRTYTAREISEAVVRVYNGALQAAAEGTITHDECLGAKSGILAILTMLEIEYEMQKANGRNNMATIVEDDPPRRGPVGDTIGPMDTTRRCTACHEGRHPANPFDPSHDRACQCECWSK